MEIETGRFPFEVEELDETAALAFSIRDQLRA
jgi:hypothetical protein